MVGSFYAVLGRHIYGRQLSRLFERTLGAEGGKISPAFGGFGRIDMDHRGHESESIFGPLVYRYPAPHISFVQKYGIIYYVFIFVCIYQSRRFGAPLQF